MEHVQWLFRFCSKPIQLHSGAQRYQRYIQALSATNVPGTVIVSLSGSQVMSDGITAV